MKRQITNISAVAIIYRERNPGDLFLEMKDDGHPTKLVRRQLCPIGGNWIGEDAKHHHNTFDTFKHELTTELSFDRPRRSTLDLVNLGIAELFEDAGPEAPLVKPENNDIQNLLYLKGRIVNLARPFGDHINTVTKGALTTADPQYAKDGFVTLTAYYTIGLDEGDWGLLYVLQKRFGNLSNEAVTLTISSDEILATGAKIAFCHDGALRRFLQGRGIPKALKLPMVPGCGSEYVGLSLPTYAQYLEKYEIAKKPI